MDAKRLTKGKEKVESLQILLYFKTEMPPKVQLGYVSYPVREYIPTPLRCFRFGHIAAQCRGKIRCAKCGENIELKCCNCGGQHSAAYGGCEKQKEAREVLKYKIIHQVSYVEALKKVNDNDRNSQ